MPERLAERPLSFLVSVENVYDVFIGVGSCMMLGKEGMVFGRGIRVEDKEICALVVVVVNTHVSAAGIAD